VIGVDFRKALATVVSEKLWKLWFT